MALINCFKNSFKIYFWFL